MKARALLILIFLIFLSGQSFASGNLYQSLGLSPNSPAVEAGTPQTPLPANQAFQPKLTALKGLVKVQFDIAKGYHLYKDRLKFSLSKGSQAKIGAIQQPKGHIIQDPFFGKQAVYNGSISINVPIEGTVKSGEAFELHYQGCSKTLCYPPVDLSTKLLPQTTEVSEQGGVTDTLHSKSIWLSLASLLLLGILLAFTPCVLPMIPILSGIIVGQNQKTFWRGFSLSLAYVLGMAITYAILGIIITKIGASFQSALQSPWVIVVVAALFVILAISMFGLFNIQLPEFLRHKTLIINNKLKGGSLLGVFVMGVVSTLVISPCTSAPLIGVLSYVIQTGDVLYGGLALFVLGLGMGIPLLIIGCGFSHLIPKAGAWMQQVRLFIGFLMLGVAVYLLARIVPLPYILSLTGILLIFYALFLGTFKKAANHWHRLGRGLGIVLMVYGIILFIGGLMGNRSFLMPLKTSSTQSTKSLLQFQKVSTQADLNRLLNQAKMKHEPVMIDFFASWCVECHKLESFVFTKRPVAKALRAYKLIQVDVSEDNVESKKLMNHYQVIGLPTLIFLDGKGTPILSARLVGDISDYQLIQQVNRISAIQK